MIVVADSSPLHYLILLEQTPDLPFGQRSGAVPLDGKRFERLPWQIGPAAFERCRNVIRQIECDLHLLILKHA